MSDPVVMDFNETVRRIRNDRIVDLHRTGTPIAQITLETGVGERQIYRILRERRVPTSSVAAARMYELPDVGAPVRRLLDELEDLVFPALAMIEKSGLLSHHLTLTLSEGSIQAIINELRVRAREQSWT